MGHSTVRRNLSVDVTALLLVQVDLRLQDVDFLCLTLQLGSKQVFLHLDIALLLLILVVEDVLVIAIELAVELQLLRAELFNHIQ